MSLLHISAALLALVSFVVASWKVNAIALGCFVFEGALLWYACRARSMKLAQAPWMLILSTAALLLADSIYNFEVLFSVKNPIWVRGVQEASYTLFHGFLFVWLVRNFREHFRSGSVLVFSVLIWLAYMIPAVVFIHSDPGVSPTSPFFYWNTRLYSFLSGACFSLAALLAVRSLNRQLHLFFQGYLLLVISDYTIRFNSQFSTESYFGWPDVFWMYAIGLMAAGSSGFLTLSKHGLIGFFSVRSLLAIVTLGSALALVPILRFLNVIPPMSVEGYTSLLLVVYGFWFIANRIGIVLSARLSQQPYDEVQRVLASDSRQSIGVLRLSNRTYIEETDKLIHAFNALVDHSFGLASEVERQKSALALAQAARQVAHDIRSPISAIDALLPQLTELPESKRVFLRTALTRLKDIANSLKIRGETGREVDPKSAQAGASTQTPELLLAVIDSLITEKRVQFRSDLGVEIHFEPSEAAFSSFSKIDLGDFKRALSNLINNSVEALPEQKGLIEVRLARQGDQNIIELIDNGSGIPDSVLARLGEIGVTEGKADGTGLGLSHAKTAIEAMGGTLSIRKRASERGTEVRIALPGVPAPHWFKEGLWLRPDQYVVALDDDLSIHQVWISRLERTPGFDLKRFVSLSTGSQLRDWLGAHPEERLEAVYLFDYELMNQPESGLELIAQNGLERNATLVTSRYDEAIVRARAKEMRVKILPKQIAHLAPIAVKARAHGGAAIVLIDDDFLVHQTWRAVATQKGVKLTVFFSVDEFLALADEFEPSKVAVYIDSNLGEGDPGEVQAKRLADLGFCDLSLATGYEADSFDLTRYPYLKQVVSKDPPF